MRFGYQCGFRNAAMHQVVVPNPSFAEGRIGSRAAGCNHHGCQAVTKEIVGMIKPGSVNRRGPTSVFRSTKNDDGIGSMNFLLVGVMNYVSRQEGNHCRECGNRDDGPENPDPALSLRRFAHPCAKNSEISC